MTSTLAQFIAQGSRRRRRQPGPGDRPLFRNPSNSPYSVGYQIHRGGENMLNPSVFPRRRRRRRY